MMYKTIAIKKQSPIINSIQKVASVILINNQEPICLDFAEFASYFPAKNLVHGLQVPWEDSIRNPQQNNHGARTENQKNYYENQKRLRIAWFILLLEMKKGAIETTEQFEEWLTALHVLSLTGENKDSFYLTFDMIRFFSLPLCPSLLLPSDKHKIYQYHARTFRNPEETSLVTMREIFEKLKKYIVTQDSSIMETAQLCCDLLVSTYCTPKSNGVHSTYLYKFANHSFFMNLVNGLRRLNGYNGISHGEEDLSSIDKKSDFFYKALLQKILGDDSGTKF